MADRRHPIALSMTLHRINCCLYFFDQSIRRCFEIRTYNINVDPWRSLLASLRLTAADTLYCIYIFSVICLVSTKSSSFKRFKNLLAEALNILILCSCYKNIC